VYLLLTELAERPFVSLGSQTERGHDSDHDMQAADTADSLAKSGQQTLLRTISQNRFCSVQYLT